MPPPRPRRPLPPKPVEEEEDDPKLLRAMKCFVMRRILQQHWLKACVREADNRVFAAANGQAWGRDFDLCAALSRECCTVFTPPRGLDRDWYPPGHPMAGRPIRDFTKRWGDVWTTR